MNELDLILNELPNTAKVISKNLGITSPAVKQQLKPLIHANVVLREIKCKPMRGQPAVWYSLVGPRPPSESDQECPICDQLLDAYKFFPGGNGRSACCKNCYGSRPDEVQKFRALAQRLRGHARRAKIQGSLDPLLKDYAQIIQNDPCAYCGGPMQVLDHIDPLSKDGYHQWDNLTPACARCNTKKSDKALLTFLESRLDKAS